MFLNERIKKPRDSTVYFKNILGPRKENKEETQIKVFKKTVIQICGNVLTALVTARLES